MTRSHWRSISRRTIQAIIDTTEASIDESTLRRRISEAYPFGPRENHPYKIWCDEVKRAMAAKFPKPLDAKDLKGTMFEGWK